MSRAKFQLLLTRHHLRNALPGQPPFVLKCKVTVVDHNEHATWPGPRRLTQAEIRTTFEQGWEVEAICSSRFEVVDGSGGAAAWLASIRRLPALLQD